MLTIIPFLSFLLFSVAYPLCFWLSFKDPLKNNFHHFHIGLPCVTAGLSILGLYWLHGPIEVFIPAVIWFFLFLVLVYEYWNKKTVNAVVISVLCGLGVKVYILCHSYLLGWDFYGIISCILGGLILACAFYAMNLGHWYLNVHGLPLGHLERATIALGVLLALRLVWDVSMFASSAVMFNGEWRTIIFFVSRLEGIFLFLAFFFGTLFPLASIYFVWGTLKAKSTQSATGILYVLLSALLIGDIAYKYYLLNYHLAF
ncbi:MAG: hypothetical protein JNN05_09350 [Candidatus Omnitrophica bacterium]|nr:hypothetical protein [Candidatus Omnitrophota bacterium]